MREKPLVDKVDVVIGSEGEERLVTVAKPIADRWPDVYRPARDVDPAPITSAADLPVAADTAAATAATATTAGTTGVTTEGVTS
jgi:hypothetical protein